VPAPILGPTDDVGAPGREVRLNGDFFELGSMHVPRSMLEAGDLVNQTSGFSWSFVPRDGMGGERRMGVTAPGSRAQPWVLVPTKPRAASHLPQSHQAWCYKRFQSSSLTAQGWFLYSRLAPSPNY
jgi:hypothetical protein